MSAALSLKWFSQVFVAGLAATWLAACSEPPLPPWAGYVEGDFVYVAAPLPGRLQSVWVEAGQSVASGQALFALEAVSEDAARAEAAERLSGARAQAADLDKGRRPDELALIRAQQQQAQAAATLAANDLARQRALQAQGFVAPARVDDAQSTLRQAQGRLDELAASLRVAGLAARDDARRAAGAATGAAREVLRQAEWRFSQKQQAAPVTGQVSDVLFRPGEYVGAGQPVVVLLPPAHIRARFFVPESDLAHLRPGQRVALACDACAKGLTAIVSRIASQPEYTPPVIYSNAQRARLVYMVEARPEGEPALQLKPGQPLDVRALPAAPTAARP